MKNLVTILILLVLTMSVTMQSYAYESPVDATAAYQQIKAAARARREAQKGLQNENFYIMNGYNLSKIKTICVIINIPNDNQQYIGDPYIKEKYFPILEKEFGKNKVTLINYSGTKIQCDATLVVNILAYRQMGISDVILAYRLFDAEHGNNAVLAYDYSRVKAQDDKEKMIVDMTKKFKSKYFQALK